MGGMRDMLAPLLHWASSLHKATARAGKCIIGLCLAGVEPSAHNAMRGAKGLRLPAAWRRKGGRGAVPASWRPVRATSIAGGVPQHGKPPRWVVGTSEREQGSNARPTWRWAAPGASCPLRSPLQLPPSSEQSGDSLKGCRWDVLASVRSVGASGALLLSLGSVASVL